MRTLAGAVVFVIASAIALAALAACLIVVVGFGSLVLAVFLAPFLG